MDSLNLNHLRYFWAVFRTGSIAAAGKEMHLSQPTISTQVKLLERSLGGNLFERVGRGLVPTELGRMVFSYADEIFSLSREMVETARHLPEGRPLRLRVGVANVVPKLCARRLLQPALELERPVHLICHEDRAERLEAELSSHGLDLVISDAPLSSRVKVQAFSHLLGSCEVTFCGAPELAQRHRRRFPDSLDDAPMLLPTEDNVLRSQLERWFERIGVRPRVVAEFDDTALLKEFGQDGLGLFPIPAVIERDVKEKFGVRKVGTAPVTERFYAISLERRVRHEAVRAICDAARDELFNVA
jgi:LysR family transcriptional activator of nhaA